MAETAKESDQVISEVGQMETTNINEEICYMENNIKTEISKLEYYLKPTDELIGSNDYEDWRNDGYREKNSENWRKFNGYNKHRTQGLHCFRARSEPPLANSGHATRKTLDIFVVLPFPADVFQVREVLCWLQANDLEKTSKDTFGLVLEIIFMLRGIEFWSEIDDLAWLLF